MASSCEIQLYAPNEEQARELSSRMIAEVQRVEAKYSRYRSDSILSRINAAAGSGIPVPVDDETAALLSYANTAYYQSDGLFDITSGVLRVAWDFKLGTVPTASQLSELLPLIGWQKVQWTPPTISLPLSGMQIDMGGIGKEYAVDRAVGIALDAGALAGLVNLGGDVRVFGVRPESAAWSIGIAHPRKPGTIAAYLPIKSGALATSGDYERFFEANGQRYCHILNPRTGWPVCDLQSVSIFAPSCLVAGTLATTTMLFGSARGERLLREQKVSALLIDAKGRARTV